MSESGQGDVRKAIPEEPTYVHGDSPGPGPRTTQAARTEVGAPGRGRDRGPGERLMVPREKPTSYYGRPVVKPPVWTWEIPTYFFTGGLAGASAGLGFVAEREGNRPLARTAWLMAFAGIAVSPVLLISDLGKPSRFLNMLRVFKVTSPMSVGSWLLLLNGGVVPPAAAYAWIGWPRRIGPISQGISAALGMPLVTYTAVLVANTSVPAWSEGRWGVPFGFAAGGAASAGAAATMLTPPRYAAPARRLAVGGAIAETIVSELMERGLGEVARPYREGTGGRLMRAAKALSLGGAAALAFQARRSRGWAVAGAAVVLAGAALERWAVFRAGFQSAEDPEYTVGPQRARADGRARTPAS